MTARGKSLTAVQNHVVIPITTATAASDAPWKGVFKPKGVADFTPGVAIFLNHLDPPLSVAQIKQRIADEQQSEAGGTSAGTAAADQEFTVIGAMAPAPAAAPPAGRVR